MKKRDQKAGDKEYKKKSGDGKGAPAKPVMNRRQK